MLVEFSFPNMENASIEINVGTCQRERFGDAQPARCKQPEDASASGWSQAMFWCQTTGRIEQCTQLGLCVDVRDEPSVRRAKNGYSRHTCKNRT